MTQQVLGAGLIDGDVAAAFNDVSYLLKHPGTLVDEAVPERVAKALTGREQSLITPPRNGFAPPPT